MLTATVLPTFAPAVGVAPSTITMNLGAAGHVYYPYATPGNLRGRGLGIIDPNDSWLTGRPYGPTGTVTLRIPPGGGPPSLAGALGLTTMRNITGKPVPSGTAVIRIPAGGGAPRFEGALGIIPEPAEIIRSLSGSPGLGIVPTERDLSKIYGYWPVHTGWIQTQRKSLNPWPQQMSFGDASSDAVATLARTSKAQFVITAITAAAITAAAVATIIRAAKG